MRAGRVLTEPDRPVNADVPVSDQSQAVPAKDLRGHVPVVVRGSDKAGIPCWRVICDGCSSAAEDYVETCQVREFASDDWPPTCLYSDPARPTDPGYIVAKSYCPKCGSRDVRYMNDHLMEGPGEDETTWVCPDAALRGTS